MWQWDVSHVTLLSHLDLVTYVAYILHCILPYILHMWQWDVSHMTLLSHLDLAAGPCYDLQVSRVYSDVYTCIQWY